MSHDESLAADIIQAQAHTLLGIDGGKLLQPTHSRATNAALNYCQKQLLTIKILYYIHPMNIEFN